MPNAINLIATSSNKYTDISLQLCPMCTAIFILKNSIELLIITLIAKFGISLFYSKFIGLGEFKVTMKIDAIWQYSLTALI